jgi:F-type H+-transporting ATPase subunit delta
MISKDRVVAGRYAKAFFEASKKAGSVDASRQDLKKLAQLLRADEALGAALRHPLTPAAEKKKRAMAALGKPAPLLERLLELALAKKRLDFIPLMAAQFDELADEADGVRKVHVKGAAPLAKAQLEDLEKRLGKAWGLKVAAEASVDENLLGGLVLRVGDKVWDRSLRGQLRGLKEKLLESTNI